MVKSELIQRLCTQNTSLSVPEMDAAVRSILEGIEDALASGRRVEVRGFGVFTVKHQKKRQARNPKTGDSVKVDGKYKIHFKPGKELRERVNASMTI